ncbi:hypothetical protein [Nocardia sp. NBC_01329]|uniref:hypothetical protein n=1 Tax=Nocardia sp. NBC_01329 TaxID=2903594 RepID=UPI002E103783|nr:hypothetical protein OG405_22615 [Nocardia sp. NBC_01329]
MNQTKYSLQDLAGSDMMVTIDRHHVDSPPQISTTAQQVMASWHDRPDGLLSLMCLVNMSGDSVIAYRQWSAAEAEPPQGDSWPREADTYRLRHSSVFDDVRPIGCVVVSTFDFRSSEDGRQWTDLMSEALQSHQLPIPGLLGQFLHVRGASVLNCSAWADVADHVTFVNTPFTGDRWQKIQNFPGLVHGPGARCRIHAARRR